MKSLILSLLLVSSPAWAILANYGGLEPNFNLTEEQKNPHLQENFQFQASFLLDWATFGRRDLTRLDLDGVISRSSNAHKLMSAYKIEAVREGTMVIVVVEGRARDMLYFFDSLLRHNIVSSVHVKDGIFSTPSEEYKRHWSDTYLAVKREIETRAMISWGAKQTELSAAQLCSRMVEIQRIHAPANTSVRLNESNGYTRSEPQARQATLKPGDLAPFTPIPRSRSDR